MEGNYYGVYEESFDEIDEDYIQDLDGIEEYVDDGGEEEVEFNSPMELLNTVDYSLNSPLIADELVDFIEYLGSGMISPRWNQSLFNQRMRFLDHYQVPRNFKSPFEVHSYMAELMLTLSPDLKKISAMMKTTEKSAKKTSEVVTAFVRGWTRQNYLYKQKNIPIPILKWGAFFLDFYWMTQVLNAKSLYELRNLAEVVHIEFTEEGGLPGAIKGLSDILGKFVIARGLVAFPDHGLLFDRNLILMYKDVFAARFQTLLSMIDRYDDKFGPYDWSQLNDIYKLGDMILRRSGNEGYNAIKMVEPICNLKCQNFVKSFRPLIPDFPNFEAHVNTAVESLASPHVEILTMNKLIQGLRNIEQVLTVYGSFRHWGHPFIDYLGGLESLHEQVNMDKDNIDVSYANLLASDMAKIVITHIFQSKRKWPVDGTKLEDDHPLKGYIVNTLWPPVQVLDAFGDNWHKLPLMKCFFIPDLMDLSTLYSDKSHSMNRSEIVKHIQMNPGCRIPSKKVMVTLFERPSRNWNKFLQQINDHGLSLDSLVIGLKGKEREIKIKGRFFSLMSWDLRDYFVLTEYLIKEFLVPLFSGLTMADDLTKVVQKMMNNSSGQGCDGYERITIAHHLDYTKWNNHQRKESTDPVFRVMGQFFGLPNLFTRTHEFFEQSWIYYNDRADLMHIERGQLTSHPLYRVCWNGQKGGLEGLRQKGWSILNLLVIRRETANFPTSVKTLAQGDNQVICCHYILDSSRNETELRRNLEGVKHNSELILAKVMEGAEKLGLIINKDETMQSADYLNYGKIPIIRGNMRGLETKRWARVTCTDNDQIPTLGNIISSVSSNALTVAHYSHSPVNSMFHYNYLGNFAYALLSLHNPALRCRPSKVIKKKEILQSYLYKIVVLFLDPSLKGVCGTSLTRFLIRMFPDPITEGLTFQKAVHDNTADLQLQALMRSMGNPRVKARTVQDFRRLVEDPLSLNIPRGLSSSTMLQMEIKKHLLSTRSTIQNTEIRTAFDHQALEENQFYTFLESIQPLFPRFLSMYKDATFLGITDGIIGLFQNSRTIRSKFSNKLSKELDQVIIKSELASYAFMIQVVENTKCQMWTCSAAHADQLRLQSWGQKVYGATVPHPLEMINSFQMTSPDCRLCETETGADNFVAVMVPDGLADYEYKRGPHPAYLGSYTSRQTKIFNPWESNSPIPLITRAQQLRDVIGWFVPPDSNLARTIFDNLHALTGEDWEIMLDLPQRTGSALHRADCKRQSSGGFSAQSPMKLNYIITTTSTLEDLGDVNYDFMFQALILYSQMTVGEVHDKNPNPARYHFHVKCTRCLRPIDEIMLDTKQNYKHSSVSEILNQWKPESIPWRVKSPQIRVDLGDWSKLNAESKSYFIGLAEAFKFGIFKIMQLGTDRDTGLFPICTGRKVDPASYCLGILEGLLRASSIDVVYRRSVVHLRDPNAALYGGLWTMIGAISQDMNMINIWRNQKFINEFVSKPHKAPSSYPLHNKDLGKLGQDYLLYVFSKTIDQVVSNMRDRSVSAWIFSDLNQYSDITLMALSEGLTNNLSKRKLTRNLLQGIREAKDLIAGILDEVNEFTLEWVPVGVHRLKAVNQEVRHAAKSILQIEDGPRITQAEELWGKELTVRAWSVNGVSGAFFSPPLIEVPKRVAPIISGLRQFQQATGSHYKLRAILAELKITPDLALCGGDGSGGLTSCILRLYPNCKTVFNSLMDFENLTMKGSNPAPPSAILSVPAFSDRCLNLLDVWKYPDNLSRQSTWDYFKSFTQRKQFDLIVLDMEVRNENESDRIEELLVKNIKQLMNPQGVVIYKTYAHRILNKWNQGLLKQFLDRFEFTQMWFTELTSTSSSEIYLSGRGQTCYDFPRYPTQEVFNELRSQCFAFQSDIAEFERAKIVSKYNFWEGIPRHYQVEESNQLMKTLILVGIKPGVAYDLVLKTREIDQEDSNGAAWFLFFIVGFLICPISRPYNFVPVPPSNQVVLKLGSWITGFMLWAGVSMDDYPLYSQGQSLIDNIFPFTWTSVSISGKYYQCWSLGQKLRVKKKMHLDKKSALIGSIIRSLSDVLGPVDGLPQEEDLNLYLREFDRGAGLDRIRSRTGLFECLAGDFDFEEVDEICSFEPILVDAEVHAFQE